ncbi:2,3-dihydro-2,3-dihydroxybenzoate dehydrogenase [Chloroflexia bacterium SDU3-3]|nr:2,3-dihydro-2,3-dihydroxybenzoate dehydrogenase [Chloroflexia bacterium SDU3-3]
MGSEQVALVTGAAQGIGAAVAWALAREGMAVAALDRQAEGAQAVAAALRAEGHRALALAADVADRRAAEAAVAEAEAALGPIGVLANVAGVLRMGAALDVDEADWHATFAVNTSGVLFMSQSVGRRMLARGGGCIVTVGSNAASVPRVGMAAYAASKAATAMLVKTMGLELAVHGIRCNLVSPGSTDTAMQRQLWRDERGAAATIAGAPEAYRVGIPLGRIAAPEDVAEAVVFLASERARHITMHDLRVDGGATLGCL